jgi:hypothetical protein
MTRDMRALRSAFVSVSVGDRGAFSSLAIFARSLVGKPKLAPGGKRKLAKVLMSASVKSFVRLRQHSGMRPTSSAVSADEMKSWCRITSS